MCHYVYTECSQIQVEHYMIITSSNYAYLTKFSYVAIIMLSPTSPLLGVLGELVRIQTFEKLNSPPIGEQPGVKSLCILAGIHFRKLPNS